MQETNTKLTKKRTNETEREIQRRDYQAKNRRKYKKLKISICLKMDKY